MDNSVFLGKENISEEKSRLRIPSTSVKPIQNRSRLPTFKSSNSTFSCSFTSHSSQTPLSASNSMETAFAEVTKSPCKRAAEPNTKVVCSKRLKPIENSRVTALKSTTQKAARRSISNALKISRKCNSRGPSTYSRNPASTLFATSKASTGTKLTVGKDHRLTQRVPPMVSGKKKTIPNTSSNKKSTSSSRTAVISRHGSSLTSEKRNSCNANTSASSTSSAGSVAVTTKKPKRKPWDLKGQVQDLKEELAESRKKQSVINSILERLEILEAEKSSLSSEKTFQEVKLEENRSKVFQLEREKEELIHEKEELKQQLHFSRKLCDDYSQDLRRERQEKTNALDELEILNRKCKEAQELNQKLREEIKSLTETQTIDKNRIDELEKESRLREEDRRRLLNDVQELKGNIRVFCRVRPLLKKEKKDDVDVEHIKFVGNEKSLIVTNDANKPTTYTFDKVFNTTASQLQVFGEVYQLVESVLDGYNVCIFAYGQTGAGKTYTMEGDSDEELENEGIIPRAMKLILQKVEEKKRFDWEYTLSVQHAEIYQENLQDLLQSGAEKLEIKTVTNGGKQKIWVKNLSSHDVVNFKQIRQLLNVSKKKRVTASTAANDRSSRSHSVFILKSKGVNTNTGEEFESCLNLIDLAGSERVAETGSCGTRLNEAKKINTSLAQLSNVIAALANKENHVPYRNSKLTFLLMDSLGGNSKTLMLVNVNPTRRALGESINTLRFATTVNQCHIGTAQKAQKIKFNN